MRKVATVELRLAATRAPPWLVERMIKLSRGVCDVLIDEYGPDVFLSRISDPLWFQSLAACLGWEWCTSGATTVLCGVLRSALDPAKHGIAAVGGKGKLSRQVPAKLATVGQQLDLAAEQIDRARYASRMAAKVDTAAVQAGYPIYHHTIFVTDEGKWAVVQQGMRPKIHAARRYHWLSDQVRSFVDEPHSAILGDQWHDRVLNMTAKQSTECRKVVTDLIRDHSPSHIRSIFRAAKIRGQRTLEEWFPGPPSQRIAYIKLLPSRVDWTAMQRAYELKPANFEELLSFKGIGLATVRGLALLSELMYGCKPSWQDPVKFSFAFGSKDGTPFPVDRKAMDEAHEVLKAAVQEAKIGKREKLEAIRRLSDLTYSVVGA